MFGQYLDKRLSDVDPDVQRLIGCEERRQLRKIIMIASESLCPAAVRETLTSVFTNLYAEGYPSTRLSGAERNRVMEVERYLAFHRRYGDRRFYKGTEFVNFAEVLAQKRAAEIFANDRVPAAKIQVNVQPLSGAAANNAVYEAFVPRGETVMGMSLAHGGHLSHGSPFNRSGKHFKIVPYFVNLKTGRIDYDAVRALAKESRPKMVIGGASAYPWDIDWAKLREIIDEAAPGAILMADISHVAGLVVAGLFPSPIGCADVTTMTTHKTLCGPRSAMILTTDPEKAARINTAVFPGEQGGPHINTIAAMAVCFGLAQKPEFHALQKRIVENAAHLAESLRKRGFKLVYGGTNTHLLLVDLNKVKTETGMPLKGDVASNILDLCGITCNKNAIPGDETGTRPGGIRLGTVIPSQLGMGKAEMEQIAGIIHRVLTNIRTFQVRAITGVKLSRGKIDQKLMGEIQTEVEGLMKKFTEKNADVCGAEGSHEALEIRGERAGAFLQQVCTSNIMALDVGKSAPTLLLDKEGVVIADVVLKRVKGDDGLDRYLMATGAAECAKVRTWLKNLSDGYVLFDQSDLKGKIDGPVEVKATAKVDGLARASGRTGSSASAILKESPELFDLTKPYFIGQGSLCRAVTPATPKKKEYRFQAGEADLRRTTLYKEHLKQTKPNFMVPFAGWSMPVWYTRASEEHAAVREAAGLFDVSHMGRIDIKGAYACRFIDLVTTNFVPLLKDGMAHYSYVLDPAGSVMDDILVYRFASDHYFLIVNASNAEKILGWLTAVNNREVIIDPACPWKEVEGRVEITDVRSPEAGNRRNVNVALQGPNSEEILLKIAERDEEKRALMNLKKFSFMKISLGGIAAVVARTGYTGEEEGYEILTGADESAAFWNLLLDKGRDHGIKPCGLAARDSLRLEAGLPLYGHELEGDLKITPTEAGYGGFVKRHKTFFVGRAAYLEKDAATERSVVRFQLLSNKARLVKPGDVVTNGKGEKVGTVTSCTLIGKIQGGMALVSNGNTRTETPLGIILTPREGKGGAPQKENAVVLQRFPMRKNRKRR